MLAARIIPTLLQRGDKLVKGQRFNSWRSVGHVRQAIRIYQSRGVDELIYLDIGATPAGRGPDFNLVESFADECFMPLTVGGGVRSVNDVRRLLEVGADKVAICTASTNCELLTDCASRLGAQAIVASIDVLNGNIAVECGKKVLLGNSPPEWAALCEKRGAGEILLTCVEREGTMEGYDLDLIGRVANAVNIPVIAHGGCSGYDDMYDAIKAGASAVAAGALFQFTDCTPKGAAEYLSKRGVETRI